MDDGQGECTLTFVSRCGLSFRRLSMPGRDAAGGGRKRAQGGLVCDGVGSCYRVRRARFASTVWERDWVRCLGVTV